MIKYLILLLNFIGFLLIDLFMGEVNVTINAPAEADLGTSFLVEVTITKSDLDGFARYQQDFPVGYTPTMVNAFNGDAKFKDQKLKIIWYKIPTDSTFTISYNVFVDPTVTTPLNLGGTFNYIHESEVKTYTIPGKTVVIRGQGLIVDNNQNNTDANNNGNQNNTDANNGNQNQQNGVDTSSQQTNNYIANKNFPVNEIFCYRQVVRDQNDITVHLLINTADLSKDKFAKIQEKIPFGFTATNLESKDGIFSFKDNYVKFLWMTLPAEKQFEISYKLTASIPITENPGITGSFSYIENEATQIKDILNRDFIDGALIASNNQNNNSNNQTNNNQINNQDSNNNQNNNNANNNQNNNQNNQNNNYLTDNNNQNNNSNNQIIPHPETGVTYKVQIAAGHTPVNPKYYFKNLNVTEKVQMEQHEGWHKYTIGSFTIYKDARDRRIQIWQNTPIHDAFVSAYNNGSRITVQEALMVANQSWYQ